MADNAPTRRPMVAGNWKMNGARDMIATLLDTVCRYSDAGVEVAVMPPAVYLADVAVRVAPTQVGLGAQHVDWRSSGAFTGEISPGMLKDLGCTYCLVGHSERHQYFGEIDETVSLRFEALLAEGITPVLCIGETLEERNAGDTEAVVIAQLQAVINRVGDRLADGIVAYEPVWAIGTGESATPEMAQAVHAAIRANLPGDAEAVRLLYGGSVNAGNAASLFAEKDIDGALVGGASLKGEDFVAICEAAAKS